jgi:tetratricopeptide (TPR) repeat protein/predicted Ser/Thr protein kinase
MVEPQLQNRNDADELPPSSLVDNMYRVVRLIGRGGMGSVYEAEDIRLGRPVALKVLRSDLARQLQADERFLQEAKILARIRSPFVATVYSIGATAAGRTYIAMEYIEGESLGDLLDRERWLPLPRAARIAQRVCEALMEAHKLGIIHRDLKPDNILLTRIGSVDDYVKVVDLGLAKHIATAGVPFEPKMTQHQKLVVGTPAYMSPEQAAGQQVSPASDLYSLAVIFYEMICGKLPIDGETPQDFLRAHQLQPPVPLAQRRTDIVFPPQVDAFFQRTLAKSPTDRPADARMFVTELERLEGIVAESRSAKSVPTAARIARRHGTALVPVIEALDAGLERAKDRVRLELAGLASPQPGSLYESFDAFVGHVAERADAPVVYRVRVPPGSDRLPLACLFDDIRQRSGLYDDDAPSTARRKLLSWVQGLMPDRPDRASQVAHLIGLFLRVEFPDSPHLSHARAAPDVARTAALGALADTLRGIAGRSLLVIIVERADQLTETEATFVRRLLRQLGAAPVLVALGWVGPVDGVPAGFMGTLAAAAIASVPADDARPYSPLEPGMARTVAAITHLGMPVWPDLVEAAVGMPVVGHIAQLVAQGILRPMPYSHLSTQVEYLLGESPQAPDPGARPVRLDYESALSWIYAQSQDRLGLWATRVSRLEASAGDLIHAAAHARMAADLARSLGATAEAVEGFERARSLALALEVSGDQEHGALELAEAAIGLTGTLFARGDFGPAGERALEAIEHLRGLTGLREEDWYRLGVPLLSTWAMAEAAYGRPHLPVPALAGQIDLINQSQSAIATDQLLQVRLALGVCLEGAGDPRAALEVWTDALDSLPLAADPVRFSELTRRISEAYRALGDGDLAVRHARKSLAASRDARNLLLEVASLRALALALRDIGELDDAEAQLGEALNAVGRVDQHRLAAEILVLQAAVLQARGATEQADAALAKACRAFAAMADLAGLSDALRQRGEIQMTFGIYARAQAFAEEAARQAVLAADVPLHIHALLLMARAAAASGASDVAHNTMETAFHMVATDVPTVERADCMVVLADLLEAGVLTSEQKPTALLQDAQALYREVGSQAEADRLARRLRAMRASSFRELS